MTLVFAGVIFCVEGTSQAEMLAFLFGAARESEKLAKRVSHDCVKRLFCKVEYIAFVNNKYYNQSWEILLFGIMYII